MSKQPRKERLRLYTLPSHERRKQIAAHLAEDLLLKYNTRSVTVRTGDEVRVLRGDFKGHKGKVLDVDSRSMSVTVEGVTVTKADHTQKPRQVHASNLLVTKLDLSDPWRREKLGATEAEAAAKPAKPKKAPAKKEEEAEE